MQLYGIDWDGPLSTEEDMTQEQVNVPLVESPLTDDDFLELSQTISPLAPSVNYGIDLYLTTLHFISLHTIQT